MLRTLKKVEREGAGQADTHVAVTRVYINDSFPKIDFMARQIFAAISDGEELRVQLMGLQKLAPYTPINTIALRRKIADSIIPVARYHLTKI